MGSRALADPQARFQNIRDYIVRKDATVLVTGDAVQAKAVEDDDDHDRVMSHLYQEGGRGPACD
jgi:hypothetical protein